MEKSLGPIRKRTGRIVNEQGYVMVWEPTHPNATRIGYVMEHRKMMADCLGRPLLPTEEVHHKNAIRDDNRIMKGHEIRCPDGPSCCNLELWTKSQPPGQRVDDAIAWAKEILRIYSAR